MNKYTISFAWFIFIFSLTVLSQGQIKTQKMLATYYANWFEGRTTSSGHIFSHDHFTAAHATIPLGTFIKVVNPENNRWIIVKVNDRCPKKGIIDLTLSGARQLNFIKKGVIQVEIETIPDSLQILWEFQEIFFKHCIECSFESWKKTIYFIIGTNTNYN